jgi:hypothetical protein
MAYLNLFWNPKFNETSSNFGFPVPPIHSKLINVGENVGENEYALCAQEIIVIYSNFKLFLLV